MTTLHPIKSTNIHSIGYDADARDLHVKFHGGDTWIYGGVPAERYEALREAKSPGAYFHKHVRGAHTGRRASK